VRQAHDGPGPLVFADAKLGRGRLGHQL
jgi:hypothetical protein